MKRGKLSFVILFCILLSTVFVLAYGETDVNNDGVVSITDLIAVAKSFGLQEGDADFSSELDVVPDGIVSIGDIIAVARDYGTTYTYDCTPDWNCTEWTICIFEGRVRTCSDSNACGDDTSKPLEEEECVSTHTAVQRQVPVDKLATSIEFSALLGSAAEDFPAKDFYLVLQSPDGSLYRETLCENLGGSCDSGLPYPVKRILRYATSRAIVIYAPVNGTWLATFIYPIGYTDTPDIFASVASELRFENGFVSTDHVAGEPIVIEAYLTVYDEPVMWSDTEMYYRVTIDGSEPVARDAIQMFDDGDGFDTAVDGTFTGVITDALVGSLCIELAAWGENEIAGKYARGDQYCTYVSG